jgi:hypothetical protein
MILLSLELAQQEMYCQFGLETNEPQQIAQNIWGILLPILIMRPAEMSAVDTIMKIALLSKTMTLTPDTLPQ